MKSHKPYRGERGTRASSPCSSTTSSAKAAEWSSSPRTSLNIAILPFLDTSPGCRGLPRLVVQQTWCKDLFQGAPVHGEGLPSFSGEKAADRPSPLSRSPRPASSWTLCTMTWLNGSLPSKYRRLKSLILLSILLPQKMQMEQLHRDSLTAV